MIVKCLPLQNWWQCLSLSVHPHTGCKELLLEERRIVSFPFNVMGPISMTHIKPWAVTHIQREKGRKGAVQPLTPTSLENLREDGVPLTERDEKGWAAYWSSQEADSAWVLVIRQLVPFGLDWLVIAVLREGKQFSLGEGKETWQGRSPGELHNSLPHHKGRNRGLLVPFPHKTDSAHLGFSPGFAEPKMLVGASSIALIQLFLQVQAPAWGPQQSSEFSSSRKVGSSATQWPI